MSAMKKMGWQVRQAPRTVIVCDIKQDEYIEETIKAILSFAEIKNVREQIFIRYKDMFCGEIEKSDTVQSVMNFINLQKANFLSKTK